ncbi:hypothetical protein GCM10009721_06180 [Terrabacter tumescens]|uniref:SHOCT domain-containing protein n=1 Tax=Terrabacter tumescens TaxID=60443 RepID=A0ABQ2HLZ4_9MICO|nr:SHOCT domain-containing protein [Terrabacter tumescens]GGM84207.1 hypothetical protein GCM10009721_06180 [Terrabacter tumescens]
MGFMDKMKGAASQAVDEARQRTQHISSEVHVTEKAEPAPDRDWVPAALTPLYEVESHIAGKNARVRLWPDRLEWERPRGLSAGKITTGVFTVGMSLAVTGVKGGNDEHDMVLLKHVTNVSDHRDGMLYHRIDVQTSAGAAVNTISFRVRHDDAPPFRQAIIDAMEGLQDRANAPVAVVVQQPSVQSTPAAGTDLAAQLQQLAGLRDAGILSEEEFAAKKADVLSRL